MLDIDDTTDRVHGGQQLSLFNTHAGGYCFQPIHIYDAATGKPVCFLLRPGKRPSGEEAAMVLRHVIRRIRANWPRVAITVRGDGHYGTPEVMELLERWDCFYILGLLGNKKLKDLSHPWCDDVATRRALTKNKEKVRRFFQTRYGAKSWSKERRVIARVEATEQGTDVRYIVSNLPGRAKHLYEKVYCARGKMENLIKEPQALHQVRPHLLSPRGGKSVPPFPPHRRLLATAVIAWHRAKTFPLARCHLRDHRAVVSENCGARRRAQIAHPYRPADSLPATINARPTAGEHKSAEPVIGAAPTAGQARDANPQRVAKVPLNKPPSTRLIPLVPPKTQWCDE